MIRVLIVEDSPVEQALLTHILTTDPQIEVVGTASDGEKALQAADRLKPDLVTMDIHMPNLDGYETTRRIMEGSPLPIIIVSGSTSLKDAEKSFKAMEAGALALIQKPRGIGHPKHLSDARDLIRLVIALSEVKVVRRWPHLRKEIRSPSPPLEIPVRAPAEIRLVAIGASTGGPTVLQTILAGLQGNFPVPVMIVQHMASGFTEGFVSWMATSTGFPSRVATHGELLLPGLAYFAPDKRHMSVGKDGRIVLSGNGEEGGLCPSVSRLFGSVAEVYGRNAVGVLLTGMGKDGADELKLMRDRGALTIAQDMESSVVYGMPGEAMRLGAAEYIFSPDKIAEVLRAVVADKTVGRNPPPVALSTF